VKKLEILKNVTNVHFIGIGGISMSALAKYCVLCGYNVSGSDEKNVRETCEFLSCDCKLFTGHSAKNVKNAEAVIYSGAIDDNNPEIIEAKGKNIPLIKRSELLGSILKSYKNSVAIAGSHGKTTATSMLVHVFERANKSPLAFIGGEDKKFGNFTCGNGDTVITEACEYKHSFLDLNATVSVALNVDNDHLDCYGNMENLTLAFRRFLSNGIAVINADDSRLKSITGECVVSFGIKEIASYKAEKLCKNKSGGYSFNLLRYGVKQGRINLRILGKHNVYNALSAITVASIFGIDFLTIKRALEQFGGVGRRMESLGYLYGTPCYADYAHHPSEIKASLSAFNVNTKDVIVFQPHTYSRTKLLLTDFVKTLSGVETVIYSTYPARETFDAKGSAYVLYRELKKAGGKTDYASTPHELFYLLKRYEESGGRIIFVGAGDIYQLAKAKSHEKKRK